MNLAILRYVWIDWLAVLLYLAVFAVCMLGVLWGLCRAVILLSGGRLLE